MGVFTSAGHVGVVVFVSDTCYWFLTVPLVVSYTAALGTLEFDLWYERASSKLHCTILRAKVTSLFTHFLSALQPNPKSSPRPCVLCTFGDLRECDRCKIYVNSSIVPSDTNQILSDLQKCIGRRV